MRRVWIVGPIAWDSVFYLEKLPQPGSFAQSLRRVERPGGTAANSAMAIASAGIETGFAGYVGDDQLSEKLIATLDQSDIAHLHLQHLQGEPSHVAIFIDAQGERTIIGLSEDRLSVVTLEGAELGQGDIVVFHLWRDHFKKDLQLAKSAGCITVVGIEALSSDISADIVIGSHSDIGDEIDIQSALARYSQIVVTEGSRGACEYSSEGSIFQEAIEVTAIDATGAGDAFLAGYITALAQGESDAARRLQLGATWACLAVQTESSIPPKWSEVEKFFNR